MGKLVKQQIETINKKAENLEKVADKSTYKEAIVENAKLDAKLKELNSAVPPKNLQRCPTRCLWRQRATQDAPYGMQKKASIYATK